MRRFCEEVRIFYVLCVFEVLKIFGDFGGLVNFGILEVMGGGLGVGVEGVERVQGSRRRRGVFRW